jgi:hypothetical protein
MDLTLVRMEMDENGIFSELRLPSGRVIAITAEHAYDSKPKLYDGTFKCVRGTHKLHNGVPFSTFEITGVDGHSGILFHKGNWPQIDSDGCVLVGNGKAPSSQGPMVTASKVAFEEFLEIQKDINEFILTVKS